jgi:hypothetical protein
MWSDGDLSARSWPGAPHHGVGGDDPPATSGSPTLVFVPALSIAAMTIAKLLMLSVQMVWGRRPVSTA